MPKTPDSGPGVVSPALSEATVGRGLLKLALPLMLAQVLICWIWPDTPWMNWASVAGAVCLWLLRWAPPGLQIFAGFSTLLLLTGSYAAEAIMLSHRVTPAQGAARDGIAFDNRTIHEVVGDERAKGVPAVPAIMPAALYTVRGKWVTLNGQEAITAGGISKAPTIHCNERGFYANYQSDEHGFKNPAGLWNPGAVHLALIGDSYTHGDCVDERASISGVLRQRFRGTLSLGMPGNGPLLELAGVHEYLTLVKPPRVLWMFYQNDFDDLMRESQSPVLRRYLEPGFRMGLDGHQEEIDAQLQVIWKDLAQREGSASWPHWLAQIGVTRRNCPLWLQDMALHQLQTWTAHFIQLTEIRQFVNAAVAGRLSQPAPVTSRLPPVALTEVLRQARQEVEAWGGKMYFVYIPSYGDLKTSSSIGVWQKAMSAAHDAGLPVIDLLPVFRNHPQPMDLFSYAYSHYNERGYAVAAAGLRDALEQMQ